MMLHFISGTLRMTRARLLNVSTLFIFRGECIKPVALIKLFCCCKLSSNNSIGISPCNSYCKLDSAVR